MPAGPAPTMMTSASKDMGSDGYGGYDGYAGTQGTTGTAGTRSMVAERHHSK